MTTTSPTPTRGTTRPSGGLVTALRVFAALGCRGLARVDWFVEGDSLVCNEVNTMPGMTRLSQVPRMLADAGVPFDDLVDGLVRGAVRAFETV